MASKTKDARTTALKAGKAAAGARSNPYVQRLIDDPKLREDVRQAVESARHAYKRMSNGKPPAQGPDGGQEASQGTSLGERVAARRFRAPAGQAAQKSIAVVAC